MSDLYNQRGVSSQKEDVHSAIKNVDKGLFPNAFCKIVPDYLTNDPEYCLIMHSDGAGTKSSLAYAYYKTLLRKFKANDNLQNGGSKLENEDGLNDEEKKQLFTIWKNISQDSLIMNLDDLICVGAVNVPYLLSSTVNRNKNIIGKEIISGLINGNEQVISELRKYGVNVISMGGETADMPDLIRTFVVDSTLTCRMKRSDVIDLSNIQAGNVIVGLASFGQATYEEEYNSGMGSNGLTSARHDVFNKTVQKLFPECYDATLSDDIAFTGRYGILDQVAVDHEGNKLSIDAAKFVLSPTRTYAPVVQKLLSNPPIKKAITGVVHCSGGGQTKILHFMKGRELRVVKDSLFPTPKLFEIIQQESGTSWKEMYSVFNMGHRLEIYCSSDVAQHIISVSKSFNVDAKIIGKIEKKSSATQASLLIKSGYGDFHYD